MFSVQVIKNLYCYGITLVYYRYLSCSEVGFSQLNCGAETEIMISVFPLSAWSTHSLGSTLAARQKQKAISTANHITIAIFNFTCSPNVRASVVFIPSQSS